MHRFSVLKGTCSFLHYNFTSLYNHRFGWKLPSLQERYPSYTQNWGGHQLRLPPPVVVGNSHIFDTGAIPLTFHSFPGSLNRVPSVPRPLPRVTHLQRFPLLPTEKSLQICLVFRLGVCPHVLASRCPRSNDGWWVRRPVSKGAKLVWIDSV